MFTDKYKQRLYDEWKTHGKIIIGVDYDDTVSPWKLFGEDSAALKDIRTVLRQAKETGAYITCYTACNTDRHTEIRDNFKKWGIELDSINENPIELPYGHNAKPQCNIYLDDRAGIWEALGILQDVMWVIRGEKNTQNTIQNNF